MITCIFNNKGGVGKTTTAVNLATGLGQKGFKTLLVDLNAQHNATDYIGSQKTKKDIFEVLFDGADPREATTPTTQKNVDCIPSSEKMFNASLRLNMDQFGAPVLRLHSAIMKYGLREKYDHIIIDTPADLDALSANALNAADFCLIPAAADRFSMSGLVTVINTIHRTKENGCGTKVSLLGVLMCNFRASTKIHQANLKDVKAALPKDVFDTVIRQTTAVPESIEVCIPAITYKTSPAKTDYTALTEEFLKRVKGAIK